MVSRSESDDDRRFLCAHPPALPCCPVPSKPRYGEVREPVLSKLPVPHHHSEKNQRTCPSWASRAKLIDGQRRTDCGDSHTGQKLQDSPTYHELNSCTKAEKVQPTSSDVPALHTLNVQLTYTTYNHYHNEDTAQLNGTGKQSSQQAHNFLATEKLPL